MDRSTIARATAQLRKPPRASRAACAQRVARAGSSFRRCQRAMWSSIAATRGTTSDPSSLPSAPSIHASLGLGASTPAPSALPRRRRGLPRPPRCAPTS